MITIKKPIPHLTLIYAKTIEEMTPKIEELLLEGWTQIVTPPEIADKATLKGLQCATFIKKGER